MTKLNLVLRLFRPVRSLYLKRIPRSRIRSLTFSVVISLFPFANASRLTVAVDQSNRVVVTTANGDHILPPLEPDQLGIESPQVSNDGTAAGWLIQYGVPGISYPVSGMLVIWQSGHVIQHFQPDQTIWSWSFYSRSKQIALHTGPLHGERLSHCELRDVASGRLLKEWNGDLGNKAKRPLWTRGLNH